MIQEFASVQFFREAVLARYLSTRRNKDSSEKEPATMPIGLRRKGAVVVAFH
jgi:hypothetical protein